MNAISPQELAQERVSKTVNKLIDIINKKLSEPETTFPFEFTFNKDTPPNAIYMIKEIYKAEGWDSNVIVGNQFKLMINHKIVNNIQYDNEYLIPLSYTIFQKQEEHKDYYKNFILNRRKLHSNFHHKYQYSILDDKYQVKSHIIASKGSIPQESPEHQYKKVEIVIPMFYITTHYTLHTQDEEEINNNITNKNINYINRMIDVESLKCLNYSIKDSNSHATYGCNLIGELQNIITKSLDTDFMPRNIIIHPTQLKHINEFNIVPIANIKDFILQSKPIGNYEGCQIYTSFACPQNAIYILEKPENTGKICIGYETYNILEDPQTVSNQENWICSALIGTAVLKDYAKRILIS